MSDKSRVQRYKESAKRNDLDIVALAAEHDRKLSDIEKAEIASHIENLKVAKRKK